MSNLLKNIKFIAKKLFEPGEYENFLKLAARFPALDINNLLLLYYQMPTATLVAGQNAWRDNYNLHVVPGEKAICLIRPELVDENTLKYVQIGVYDVSQLKEKPDVKQEVYSITDFFSENTGYMVVLDQDNFLGDKERELIDDELFIKYNPALSQEETEQDLSKQTLLYYVENLYNGEGLPSSNVREKAIIQSVEYILCCRYGLSPSKLGSVYMKNMQDVRIEDFLSPVIAIARAIIDEIENGEYIEFSFTDVAFINMLEYAETRESYEVIFDFDIADDVNKMMDAARVSFDEKLSMISDEAFINVIDDKKNNRMMTQPPYKIKLIDGV